MYKPWVIANDQYEVSLQLSKDSFIRHPIQVFHCYLIMILFYKFPFQDFSCCASASWVVHSLNSQLIAQHANLSLISRINLSGSAPYLYLALLCITIFGFTKVFLIPSSIILGLFSLRGGLFSSVIRRVVNSGISVNFTWLFKRFPFRIQHVLW